MAYTVPPDFTPFDVLTAAQMDILGNNDVFFYAYMGAGTNAIQQVQYTFSGAYATTATTIPNDDTIPQNSEGGEFFTKAITPKSATNILGIRFTGYGDAGANNITVALFQDSTASALAATSQYGTTGGAMINLILEHYMVAGTASATTFKIRIGSEAGSFYLNASNAGTRKNGGVGASGLVITEYKV